MSRRVAASWSRTFKVSTAGTKRVKPAPPSQSQTTQWKRFTSTTARRPKPILLTAGAGILTTALVFFCLAPSPQGSRPETATTSSSTPWPRYRLSEIKTHDAASPRPWVTYAASVYDITEWIPAHPGGEVILRAAGGAVEPYWDIFSVHKQHLDDVLAVLEGYKIGEVDEADIALLSGGSVVDDPFKDDPPRDARLRTLTERPRNAETPVQGLRDFITPAGLFYVRNHMWVPVVEEDEAHAVTVEGVDGEERAYTLRELRERFPVHKVTATLQCAGNRRRDMTNHAGRTNGLQWGPGAVSTADWEGVLLRDVLADATGSHDAVLPPTAKHVHFIGLEAYAASIPVAKAVDPLGDVLLAFSMNGRPLPRDHGFPVRAIVPGNVAARSVKWLRRIVLSPEESPSQWQQRDYKTFCPDAGPEPDWSSAPAIQEMPVTSAVTAAEVSDSCKVTAEGYAYSGGGREIVRVDVSADGGRTWRKAELMDDRAEGRKAWCWKRWRFVGVLADGSGGELVVKATDEAYNTQPESHGSIYNVRGNLATAWHRVEIGGENRASGQARAHVS